MGPLFVIAFWYVITIPLGLISGGLVWIAQYRRPRMLRLGRTVIASLLPPAFFLWWMVLVFGTNGVEALTGVPILLARRFWTPRGARPTKAPS